MNPFAGGEVVRVVIRLGQGRREGRTLRRDEQTLLSRIGDGLVRGGLQGRRISSELGGDIEERRIEKTILFDERCLTFSKAAELREATGARFSTSTVWRWATQGVRGVYL